MKPAPFRYARPGSVVEAVDLLARHACAARVLAGGQSLMPLMARRAERPSWVIDINRIAGLGEIEVLPTRIRMGALVRQEQALRSVVVRQEIPGVAAALAWVANSVVRQRGTVVGNLVTNGPGAEIPAVALALGAEFAIRDAQGERVVAAAALLGPDSEVPRDALVTHVLWPRRPARAGFYEVSRRAGHVPVVSALVTLSGDDCRVAVSGVCRTGLSCLNMARVIAASFPQLPRTEDLAAALRADLTGCVYADLYSSADYRLGVAPVVSQRAIALITQVAAA